jgi:hypothetical protein
MPTPVSVTVTRACLPGVSGNESAAQVASSSVTTSVEMAGHVAQHLCLAGADIVNEEAHDLRSAEPEVGQPEPLGEREAARRVDREDDPRRVGHEGSNARLAAPRVVLRASLRGDVLSEHHRVEDLARGVADRLVGVRVHQLAEGQLGAETEARERGAQVGLDERGEGWIDRVVKQLALELRLGVTVARQLGPIGEHEAQIAIEEHHRARRKMGHEQLEPLAHLPRLLFGVLARTDVADDDHQPQLADQARPVDLQLDPLLPPVGASHPLLEPSRSPREDLPDASAKLRAERPQMERGEGRGLLPQHDLTARAEEGARCGVRVDDSTARGIDEQDGVVERFDTPGNDIVSHDYRAFHHERRTSGAQRRRPTTIETAMYSVTHLQTINAETWWFARFHASPITDRAPPARARALSHLPLGQRQPLGPGR